MMVKKLLFMSRPHTDYMYPLIAPHQNPFIYGLNHLQFLVKPYFLAYTNV